MAFLIFLLRRVTPPGRVSGLTLSTRIPDKILSSVFPVETFFIPIVITSLNCKIYRPSVAIKIRALAGVHDILSTTASPPEGSTRECILAGYATF